MTEGKVPPPHKPLPRVRTYARDLEEQRGLRSQPTSAATALDQNTKQEPPSKPSPTLSSQKTSAPLPATNVHTSTPLPTAVQPTAINLGATETGLTLSESVSAAVAATTKKSAPVIPPVQTTEKEAPSAPVAPTKIPPFHELSRTNQPSATRTGSSPAAPDDFGATIITDTQSRRFRLFPKLFTALSRWWEERSKRKAAARAPKYVVPETDRRKGVIQRATSQTAKVTTGDYEGLRQRLRERVEATVAAPNQPDHEEIDETIWTPHVESIFPLLEAPQQTPSAVQRVVITPRRKLSDAPVTETDSTEDNRWEEATYAYNTPPQKTIPPVLEPTPVPPTVAEPIPEPVLTPTVIPPQPLPPTPPVTVPAEDEDEDAPLPAPAQPIPKTNPKQRPLPTENRRRFFLHTNTITITIVGVVILGSLAVYITPRLIEFSMSETVEMTAASQSTALAAPVVTRSLSLPSKDGIMTALNIAEEDRALPAVEVALSGDISPATILQTIDPSLPPSLVQNVSDLSFGWYDGSEPFIIMTIADRASVWGGLLQIENRLPESLSPLFAQTDDSGKFTDQVVGGHDIRILIDDTEQEILSYGMIDEQTLIITTTAKTFISVETLVTTVR